MPSHKITYEQLIAFAAGELSPDEAARVEAHLAGTPRDREVVQRFRAVSQTLRADDTVAPPEASIRDARELFARRLANREQQPGLIESALRFIAELVYDSRTHLATAAVRGAATAYQLSFESEQADIDLEIEPPAEVDAVCRVTGQVSPHEEGAAVMAVSFSREGSDEVLASVEPNEHGEFTAMVPPGLCVLMVTLSNATIVIPDVEVAS